jgi:hypothetical protein
MHTSPFPDASATANDRQVRFRPPNANRLYLHACVARELAEVRTAVDCQAETMGALQSLEEMLQKSVSE